MPIAQFVTDFGNAPLLMVLSLALTAWILLRVSTRQALLFLGCVAVVAAVTALLKSWFAGCHYDFGNVHSPSGHTAFSVMAYGGVATVLAADGSINQRRWIVALYLAWVLGIGLTRVLLHDHTPQEVLAGYALGGVGAAVFAVLYRADRRPGPTVVMVAAAVMILLVVVSPFPASFESQLGWLGSWFARRFPICV